MLPNRQGHNCAVMACFALGFAPLGCDRELSPTDAPSARAATSGSKASQTSDTPTVVLLGDSLTAGLGLERDEALPALLQKEVDAAALRYRVIDAGRSGDTTAGGLSRIDWYLREPETLRAVVIGLGSNDAMRGVPVETIEQNLRAIVQRVRARAPKARLLLWQLHTFPNMGAEYGQAFAGLFERVAESEKLELIPFPLADVAGKPELNQADGVHPTREGTKRVAERVWTSLRPVLEAP
jgi:acyl-CoA thioesterase-1